MKCDELKLFLSTEGICSEAENDEVRDHLSGCSRCLEKYERMKFAVECFTSYYRGQSRAACPSAEEMIGFQEGELDARRLQTLGKHIGECRECREELALLQACDAESDLSFEGELHPPPLSEDVLGQIAKLKKKNLRKKMEHVLKTLVDKGKDALTPEKINDAIEKYLFQHPEPLPAHALPSAIASFDTDLVLNESSVCDVSINIGEYSLSIKAFDDTLIVRVTRGDVGVSGVEVIFMTKYLGMRKTTTGKDGVGVVAGIRRGPYQISVRVPRDHEE